MSLMGQTLDFSGDHPHPQGHTCPTRAFTSLCIVTNSLIHMMSLTDEPLKCLQSDQGPSLLHSPGGVQKGALSPISRNTAGFWCPFSIGLQTDAFARSVATYPGPGSPLLGFSKDTTWGVAAGTGPLLGGVPAVLGFAWCCGSQASNWLRTHWDHHLHTLWS